MRSAGVKLQKQDTEIKRTDQDRINAFSRANMKYQEGKEEIKKLKEEIDNLEDATMMVEESMGEPLKLFLGECFVAVEENQAGDYLEKLGEEKQADLEAKTEALDKLEEEMKNLKSHLYARFGTSINLDEDK